MSDYSSMEAGRELDCEIATRLGWIVEHERVVWVDDGEGARPVVYMYGKRPKDGGYDDDVRIPPYSTDANAALELPIDGGYVLDLYVTDTGYFGRKTDARIVSSLLAETTDGPAYVKANTPALAICRAWLVWKDAQS